ncbi:hypothetical protein I6E11_14735, partial [Bacteroides caecigallinarum]|uniref:hypothetical protein n=1 Tax=Bacteroides caecigallinarum TaxID=1411144 RepID=UPI001F3FA8C6
MRYLLSFCGLMLFLPLNSHSPKGRLYDHFDLGLPDGNEIVIGFIIAFVAIPIGYLISRNTKDASSKGCFGTLLIGVGIIALLP